MLGSIVNNWALSSYWKLRKISERRRCPVSEVPTFRLYLLRAGYLVIAVGLATMIWPGIIHPPENLPHMNSVVRSLLGALALLAALGVRYPLKMLPLLFFELLWKSVWALAFGLRWWSAGGLGPDARGTLSECIFGIVLVLLVTPWGYVFRHYLKAPGDRWAKNAAAGS
jgi:hypothetical protein